MKSIFTFFIFILSVVIFDAQKIILVDNGSSEYSIVIRKNADKNEKIAAKIFQDYIFKISGCSIPISNKKSKSGKDIIIDNKFFKKNKIYNATDLKNDGYIIKTSGEKLILSGGSERGIIYAVTGFLEDHLKVRVFTPEEEYVPKSEKITIPYIDEINIPPAEMRMVQTEFTNDSIYSYFRKITGIDDHWKDGDYHGYYVHTFQRSVPSEKYFESNPEYFALINGKRVPFGQLCLSNPAVLEIVKKDIQEQISKHPKLKYWSVSQNDNYYHCECDNCKAIDQEEGSPSGLMLRFVNEIARTFPDKTITTLAYQYTRKPPLKTKPLKNVLVTLCTIELNRSKPIEDDSSSSEFVQEIMGWARITDNLKIWDYETQFTNSFCPFPLYNTLQPNIQLFTRYNAKAHFQQCNAKHSENFSELKSYLLSKLLWNPNANVNSIINEFLFGFYGDAAPYLRLYFNKLHEESMKSGVRLDIYGSPVWFESNILSGDNLKKYNEYFDMAEDAVKNHTIHYNRVRAARLPLMFSTIEIAKTDLFGQRGWYEEVNGKFVKKSEMNKILDDFYSICQHDSIGSLNEKGLTPEFYYKNTLRNINVEIVGNKAFRKKVSCIPEADPRYTGAGNRLLTNGVKGTDDYKINWLGWEGLDVKVNIDLDTAQQIQEIHVSTLHLPDVWILHPESVKCFVSADGNDYSEIGISYSDPELKYKSDIKSFSFEREKNYARYLKLVIQSKKILPAWHAYRGNKAWVFIDEIIVK
ncbi:MAG: DUF4838 domain-containing protein [Deltaproteobacteria bacterium]